MEMHRGCRTLGLFSLLLGLGLVLLPQAEAALDLVSRSNSGEQGRAASYQPAISAGGRYVAFVSDADNLVANDRNSMYGADPDIFVFDRENGTIENASAALNKEGYSFVRTICRDPAIDQAGRFVAFECYNGSESHNLKYDIYLYDREGKSLSKVTRGSGGGLANDTSVTAAISGDGRYIAFSSKASNLNPKDIDRLYDVYIYDRQSSAFELVSVNSSGVKGNGASSAPSISEDGRYVAFVSSAFNLTGDGLAAVFIRDRQEGRTEKVLLPAGTAGACSEPSISADGQTVVFTAALAGTGPTIFLADRRSGSVRPVAPGSAPSLGGDGRLLSYVATEAGLARVFLLDLASGRTERLSLGTTGDPANGASASPSVSGHGTEVAFSSTASNLYAADGNGSGDVFLHMGQADTTPPVVALSVTPGVLWPPNKKYVPVKIEGLAQDETKLASVEITVTDEYGEMQGMIVPGFGSTVWLEAWREGDDRDGRVYTINVVAVDAAGNRTETSAPAVVPHDMRNKK